MGAECVDTHRGISSSSNFVYIYLFFQDFCSFLLAYLPVIWEIVMLCTFQKIERLTWLALLFDIKKSVDIRIRLSQMNSSSDRAK